MEAFWNDCYVFLTFSLSPCNLTAAITKLFSSHDLKQHKFSGMIINEVDRSHMPGLFRKRQRLAVRKSPAYHGAFIISAGSFIDDEDQFQWNHNFQPQNHEGGHKLRSEKKEKK